MVVEVKEHDQYVIKVDGSWRLMARNRKFLRPLITFKEDLKKQNNHKVVEGVLLPRRSDRLGERNKDEGAKMTARGEISSDLYRLLLCDIEK